MVGVRVRNTQGVTVIHSSDEFPPASPQHWFGVTGAGVARWDARGGPVAPPAGG
jgi:hypothetical protein